MESLFRQGDKELHSCINLGIMRAHGYINTLSQGPDGVRSAKEKIDIRETKILTS